jgi:flavin reductase (DIM6/NTAB) family NADH-FMN oxidoreductase RutF
VEVDPSFLNAEESYKLLTGVVVPRPIAWISTLGSNGQVNVAPFSAFTFVSTQPPMLAISLGRRLGVPKDTARNIGSRREFVVNIANFELLDSLHQSGTEYPEEVSEVELLNLKTLPGERIKTPRLAAAPVSMECVLHKSLELGTTKAQLVIGEVLLFHIREDLNENGKIDTERLNPICRLGGSVYCTLGKIFRMQGITG